MVAAATAFALAGCGGSTPAPVASPQTGAGAPATTAWPTPPDASVAASKAGLVMLGEEQLAVHYHVHVDVMVNDHVVAVPAFIGIDLTRHTISALHTHDASGVVHIESAKDIPFTLGQVFAEWGQPLGSDQVGPQSLGPGQELRVYRNGQRVTGDPAALRLRAHDEIFVWVGASSQQPKVPNSYAFAPGL
jgi:hypothetical protein